MKNHEISPPLTAAHIVDFFLDSSRFICFTEAFVATLSILGASGIVGGGSMYLLLYIVPGAIASRATISGGSGPRKLGRFFSFPLLCDIDRVRVGDGGFVACGFMTCGDSEIDGIGIAASVFVTGNSISEPSPKRMRCCVVFCQCCCGCVGSGLDDAAALANGAGMTSCLGKILLRDDETEDAFVAAVITEEAPDRKVELLLATEGWLPSTLWTGPGRGSCCRCWS